jgi:hypothetical protein
MALFVDPAVEIDGVDRTDWAHNIDMPLEADRVEVTPFRAEFKRYLRGRRDGTITIGFYQDFDEPMGGEPPVSTGDSLDQQLWELFEAGDEFDIVVEPVEGGDVEYTATVVMLSYNPLSGEQGEAADMSVEFALSGNGITRAPAPVPET